MRMMRMLPLLFGLLGGAPSLCAAATPPARPQPSVLFIGTPTGYIEPALASELLQDGYIVDSSNWAGVSIERLRRFNTVVISSWSNFGDEWKDRYADALDDYLKQGGGIIAGCSAEESLALCAKPWFEQHGLRLVHEYITDPAHTKPVPRPKYTYNMPFVLTRNINTAHPVTAGVRSLWYPPDFGGYGKPGTAPLLVDNSWRVLASTESSAVIRHWQQALEKDYRPEMEGKSGAWPIVAARQVGAGRLLVFSMNPLWYLWAPHFDKWDLVAYRNGIGGVPSDFARLFANSLQWTAAPSLSAGTLGYRVGLFPPTSQGDTAPVDWTVKTFAAPGPWLHGVVGAHTAFSTGTGTVAEWAAAAKAEGLDFIVFLDDMRSMDAEKWAKLQQQCKAASSDSFRAYPGLEYHMKIDTGGANHCFVIDGRGTLQWPLKRHLNAAQDVWIRLNEDQGPFDIDFQTNTTVGFLDHAKNVTPYWDYKLYGLFTVWSRSAQAPLDDNLPQYLEVVAANVNPGPMAIDLLSDPAQLKGIRTDGRPLLVVNGAPDGRYPQMGGGLAQVDLHVGSRGDEWNAGAGSYRGWFGPTVTEGPAVSLRFRGGYVWKGVEYPRYWIDRYASIEQRDWFMPSFARLPVRLDVESENPLREVVVYDGPRVYRRFDAQGQRTFSAEFTVPQDQNRHLVAYVTDSAGRRAVTPEIWTEQQEDLYNFCGDRINAPIGRGSEPGHGNAWLEGYVKMAPGKWGAANLYPPSLPGSGYESRRMQLDLVSSDLFLERVSSERYFPALIPYMSNPWHNWSEPALRDDVRHGWVRAEWYQSHGRQYQHPAQTGIIWDGYPYGAGDERPKFAYYAQQSMWGETKKQLNPLKDTHGVPGLSQVVWEGDVSEAAPVHFKVYRPDGTVVSGDLASVRKSGKDGSGALPDGSAIVLDAGFTVRVHGEHLGYAFYVAEKDANLRLMPVSDAPVPANTRYDWRYETVAQALEQPLQPDSSWLKVEQGKLLEHFSGAALAADGNIVRVKVGCNPLHVNSTPLEVRGVNANWTCGYFEPATGNYRPLGAVNGTTYAQLDAARKDVELVIGNVVTCDQPELRIAVTQETDAEGKATGQWHIELHNPLPDKALDANLTIDPAFSLIKTRAAKASVPAGGQVVLEIR